MILQVAKGTIIIFLGKRQQMLIAIFWKVHGPSFELNLITFTQQCFMNTGSLVEMNQQFLKRRIHVLHFVDVFLLPVF